jgi:predicted phosphodiesterase
MRTAVISDIHGNLEAFLSVLEDIQSQQTDRIVSLGDNIGYGADSESVIQLLISNDIFSVLGNHEMAAINDKIFNWYTGDIKKAIKIAIASLSEDSLRYLRESKISMSHSGCFFVHGFPPDSFRLYLEQAGDTQLRQAFTKMKDNLCFVGHTHKLRLLVYENNQVLFQPMNQARLTIQKDKKYIINAGSVGQPRDGDVYAKYVIWDSRTCQLEIRTVEYDAATAAQKIINAGIPSRFADMIDNKISMVTGRHHTDGKYSA